MLITENNVCSDCSIKLPEYGNFKHCGYCGAEIISKEVEVPYEIWRIIMGLEYEIAGKHYIRLAQREICKNCGKISKNIYGGRRLSNSSYVLNFCTVQCKIKFHKMYKNSCKYCDIVFYCTVCIDQTDCKKCRVQEICDFCIKDTTCTICGKKDIEYYKNTKKSNTIFGSKRFCGMKCMLETFDDDMEYWYDHKSNEDWMCTRRGKRSVNINIDDLDEPFPW